jgi:hypothetical protein
VEMGRIMLVEIHPNHDAKETAYFWHLPPLYRAALGGEGFPQTVERAGDPLRTPPQFNVRHDAIRACRPLRSRYRGDGDAPLDHSSPSEARTGAVAVLPPGV